MKKERVILVAHKRLCHEIYILKGICWYRLHDYDHVIRSILLELLSVLELQRDSIIHQRVIKKHKN